MTASYCLIRAAATDGTAGEAVNTCFLSVVSARFCDAGKMHEGEIPPEMEQMHAREMMLHA